MDESFNSHAFDQNNRIPEPLQEAINSELFAAEPIKILERNYQSVTAAEVTAAQTHLKAT